MEPLRIRLFKIIFGTNTKVARLFEIILLWSIFFSTTTVILESIKPLRLKYGLLFNCIEWFFTILFTIEYIVRIWVSPKPKRYIFSGLGIVDFLAILPTYLSLAISGTHVLVVIRTIRLLRVFRILKINRFMGQGEIITHAIKNSISKIGIFLFAILNIVTILGALMYVVEGEANGFDSIPRSIYWAIVTITTVGYGDISPQTPLGQFISSLIMITGYAIIAVPTGIVSAEITKYSYHKKNVFCEICGKKILHKDDHYCSNCGNKIEHHNHPD